jgi:hypothetical protein
MGQFARPGAWSDPSIAHDRHVQQQTIRITHPFHPLAGREFDLVVRKHNWAEDRVFFFADDGQLTSVPAGFTDVDAPDPFVSVAAGRSRFTVEGLLCLADLIDGMRSGDRSSVKGSAPRL